MNTLVALVDMDGTIADYDYAMKRALDELRSPGEPEYTSFSGKNEPWIEARRKLVSRIPGFWKNLPRYEAGFDVISVLLILGYELMILTKGPTTKPAAWGEKIEWCRKNLPENTPVTITEDKSLVYGRVLVDDWPEYFEPWLRHRPRGLVICPAHTWNVGAEIRHPNNVWRYDREDPKAKVILRRILKAIRDRKDGENIDLQALISEQETESVCNCNLYGPGETHLKSCPKFTATERKHDPDCHCIVCDPGGLTTAKDYIS